MRFLWFFKKDKEKRRQELLGLWEKLKKSGTLTIAELKKIILKQPDLMDEAIGELFLRENNLGELLDFHKELDWERLGYYGDCKVREASRKIGEKLINDYTSTEDLCKIFNSLFLPELRKKAARKILREENISVAPTKILVEIIIYVDSDDLKAKAAEEILKREISDSESNCLAWVIARVGPPQRERAYEAMMKRNNWKDNLSLLFNLDKNPDNILFIEKAAKDFLETSNNKDVQDILFSIVEHIKGDIGKKAAERLLFLLLDQSSWEKLSILIWKCKEYTDLQEIAAEKILNREGECADAEVFRCIIMHVPYPWSKRTAAEVILDRFAENANLELVMKNVPSLKKQAKEMLKEIELAGSEMPEVILNKILKIRV